MTLLNPRVNQSVYFGTQYFARSIFLVGMMAAFGLFASFIPSLYAATDEGPSIEELSKTEAARFYVAKQYPEALTEFKKLEEQYPKNGLIKRYIASVYGNLREWDLSIAKLQEALQIQPDDVISHQMLGDLYIKKAEFGLAREQFDAIVKGDPKGPMAKAALKRKDEISAIQEASEQKSGHAMSVEAFMRSEPVKQFSEGHYEPALQGFDQLILNYPDDVLIRRFRAIVLLRLDRTEEALRGLREASALKPDNVALRFYMGQAYAQAKKLEDARREYRWVIEHDKASYRLRAQQAIFKTLMSERAKQKPWGINLSNGYEYATNATYKTGDKSLSKGTDQNSGRYLTNLLGNYRFYKKGRFSFSGDGLYLQSIYNDIPALNVYTSGAGLSSLAGYSLWGRPFFINLREGATHTILRNKFYLWSNTLSSTFIYDVQPRVRPSLTYRFIYNQYENRGGSTRDLDNHSGFANAISFSNNFYFNEAKTRYLMSAYDFERHDTGGVNYSKNTHGVKLGFYTPIVEKMDGDITFKWKDSDYPKTGSSPPQRHEDVMTLVVSLARPLGEHFTLKGTFTYENSRARNNNYEYTALVYGLELAYRY